MCRPFSILLTIPAVFCLGISLACLSAEPASARPSALVVGNDAYPANQLRFARENATELSARLLDMGYYVQEELNVSQSRFRSALRRFARGIEPNSLALVYFGGYMVNDGEKNYLLPIGERLNKATSLEKEAVRLDEVFGFLKTSSARAHIIILDGARPINRLDRDAPFKAGFLEIEELPGNMLLLTNAQPGKTSKHRDDQIFARSFIKHVTARDVLATEIVRRVTNDVSQQTNDVSQQTGNEQRPWSLNGLRQRVYLRISELPSHFGDELTPEEIVSRDERFSGSRVIDGAVPLTEQEKAVRGGEDLEGQQAARSVTFRGSGALWEEALKPRSGRLKLAQGASVYAHPSRKAKRVAVIRPGDGPEIVGYVRTREGIFFLSDEQHKKYMAGSEPSWIYVYGMENANEIGPDFFLTPDPDEELDERTYPPGQEPFAEPVPGSDGTVYSPYYNKRVVVDVRGFKSGDAVRCPYDGRIFRVP